MRLLGDENFPRAILEELRAEGHDVTSAAHDYPGIADSGLLDTAESQSRVLLTLDKDFRQIAAQRKEPLLNGGVVLFRVHPATIAALRPLVLFFRNSDRQWPGRLTVVARSRSGAISVLNP